MPAATVAQGFFFCHFRIYIRSTFVHCIVYILCFVSFSLIKDIYIEIWGKKPLMMAEKIAIHLGELGKNNSVQKQFCFNTVFITKTINIKVQSLFLRICLFLQLLLYLNS